MGDTIIDPGITEKKPEEGGEEPNPEQSQGGTKPEEQGDIPGWLRQGSEKHQGDDFYKGFKSAKEALDAFDNLRTEHDTLKKSVPEVPEKPEEYDFSGFQVPEGFQMNEDTANWFREIAHKNGMTQQQATGLMRDYMDRQIGIMQQARERRENEAVETTNELKKQERWGPNFDRNLELVHRMAVNFGPPELFEYLDSGPGNNRILAEWIANIGQVLDESMFVDSDVEPESGELPPGRRMYDHADSRKLRQRASGQQ